LDNAYIDLETVTAHYEEMQYQKQIREEQKAAQLAQEAKQRELDENVAKLGEAQSNLAAARTALTAAETANDTNEDPALEEGLDEDEVYEQGEVDMYEEEVDGLNVLFADIEADLAYEAE
jgi:TolA-binding protein